MNRKELQQKLNDLDVPPFYYSLYGEKKPDQVVLLWSFKWEIFYFDEKGNTNNIASFDTEDEACEYFYQMMKKEKAQEEKMKNMPPYIPPQVENRTFIVSESGETNVSPDDAKKQ